MSRRHCCITLDEYKVVPPPYRNESVTMSAATSVANVPALRISAWGFRPGFAALANRYPCSIEDLDSQGTGGTQPKSAPAQG